MHQSRISVRTLNMDTLDNILKERKITKVDFLKMDIQGAEFIALQGAIETLKQVTYLTLETAFHQYNRGGAPFTDINLFLEEMGFRLYDIVDIRPAPLYPKTKLHGLVQADFLWIKADSKAFTGSIYPPPPPSEYECHRKKSQN